jgi:hypothetical protein
MFDGRIEQDNAPIEQAHPARRHLMPLRGQHVAKVVSRAQKPFGCELQQL